MKKEVNRRLGDYVKRELAMEKGRRNSAFFLFRIFDLFF